MSAITTWGWGVQGGLISTLGWGGHATIPPEQGAVGLPLKPLIRATVDLVPKLASRLAEPVARIASLDLRPGIVAGARAEQVPTVAVTKDLRPAIGSQDAGLRPLVGVTKDLRPETSATRAELIPVVVSGQQLRPDTEPSNAEPKPAVQSTVGLEPTITGTKSDT